MALMLAGAALFLMGQGVSGTDTATCEVHVWGAGRPNFKPRASFMIKIAPVAEDPNDPYPPSKLFNTAARANALSPQLVKALYPGRGEVRVAFHPEIIDLDKVPVKKLKTRLAPSPAACYGDLVITNLYEVTVDQKVVQERAGLVGNLLAGGNRLEIEFWFNDFSGARGPVTYKRMDDSPVRHVPASSREKLMAFEESTNSNLESFVRFVAEKRAH
jgi:hypothetical protein